MTANAASSYAVGVGDGVVGGLGGSDVVVEDAVDVGAGDDGAPCGESAPQPVAAVAATSAQPRTCRRRLTSGTSDAQSDCQLMKSLAGVDVTNPCDRPRVPMAGASRHNAAAASTCQIA